MLIVMSVSPAFSQEGFKNVINYGEYKYEYILSPIPKQKDRYDLKITILDDVHSPQLVYQSFVNTEGMLTKGNQYKIIVFFAKRLNNKWIQEPTSHVEIAFDLIENLFKHSSRGMIAKYQAEPITAVLDIDLATGIITESQAMDYAMQFIVVNYNQLFDQYALAIPPELVVKEIDENNTVFVASNQAPSSVRDTTSIGDKNYSYTLTETQKDSYSLEIKFIIRGEDIVSEETVYSSTLKVTDLMASKQIYRIQIFYAKGEGYMWHTTPQSYFQEDFNFNRRVIRTRTEGKIKEMRISRFAKESDFAPGQAYTSKDMLTQTVRFFIKNFNKALVK
jgi:hypothetical protein